MQLNDLMKALTQEEIVDEMLISYDEAKQIIHVTFLNSVYRGLLITGENDNFNVEVYYGMDLICDFNGVMQVINFCLDSIDSSIFYEKLYGLKSLIEYKYEGLDVVFDDDAQNSALTVGIEDDTIEISYAYGEYYIYNSELDDDEYYGYEGPFDEIDVLDIIEECFIEEDE